MHHCPVSTVQQNGQLSQVKVSITVKWNLARPSQILLVCLLIDTNGGLTARELCMVGSPGVQLRESSPFCWLSVTERAVLYSVSKCYIPSVF